MRLSKVVEWLRAMGATVRKGLDRNMKRDKKGSNQMKMLIEQMKQDGEKNVTGVDLSDLSDLKVKLRELPDEALVALADALKEAHNAIHEAMDMAMREGARRAAKEMLKRIKADPKAAEKVIDKLNAMISEGLVEGGEVTEEDLKNMKVQGHA